MGVGRWGSNCPPPRFWKSMYFNQWEYFLWDFFLFSSWLKFGKKWVKNALKMKIWQIFAFVPLEMVLPPPPEKNPGLKTCFFRTKICWQKLARAGGSFCFGLSGKFPNWILFPTYNQEQRSRWSAPPHDKAKWRRLFATCASTKCFKIWEDIKLLLWTSLNPMRKMWIHNPPPLKKSIETP